MNPQNLRPMNIRSPEERRELGRRGGIASGKARREKAEAKAEVRITLAGYDLVEEAREEYRRAIKRYIADEKKRLAKLQDKD